MFKEFVMKKMLERQLKNVPADQREKIIKAFTENPEIFKKIADEVKQKTDSGKDQMAATQEVMMKYQADLQKIMK